MGLITSVRTFRIVVTMSVACGCMCALVLAVDGLWLVVLVQFDGLANVLRFHWF